VPSRVVVVMAGLPATGKTTTAQRLHAQLGGMLIRSCDVYAELGISLPAWVERTAGFTREVSGYDAARDEAYTEMGRRLHQGLAAGADPVIVDAVHGERDRRRAVQAICQAHGATAVVVLCRCDDLQEIERRFAARRGREHEREYEASDLAVYRDIRRRWQDPSGDRPVPPIVVVETVREVISPPPAGPEAAVRVAAALLPYAQGRARS
jgi:predicted kinase